MLLFPCDHRWRVFKWKIILEIVWTFIFNFIFLLLALFALFVLIFLFNWHQLSNFIIRVLHSTAKNTAVPLCCTAAQSHTAAYSSSASIEKLFKSIYFSSKVTLALNFKVKLMANSVWHWSPKIMISMFLSKNVRKKLLTFLSQNHDFWKWPFQKIMEKCKSKSFSVSHQ